MSEIKFPKLLISYEMNLVTFILCKLHICKVFDMSFENVNFAKFKNVFENKISKVVNILWNELSNFYFVQITHLQSVRMSFENVNLSKF